MKEQEMVLYTSNKAAKIVRNISGWVDKNDRFWGDNEHGARWAGCTHTLCKLCGNPVLKGFLTCKECNEKAAIKKHAKRIREIWDKKWPVYSYSLGRYFDADELYDYIDEYQCDPETLLLLICKPIYLRCVNEDYFMDDLPETCEELPEELQIALANFNERICGIPAVSCYPTEIAVECLAFT